MDKAIKSEHLVQLIDKLSEQAQRKEKIGTGTAFISLLAAGMLPSLGAGILASTIGGGLGLLGAGVATGYFLKKLKEEKAIKHLVTFIKNNSHDEAKINRLKEEVVHLDKEYVDFAEVEKLLERFNS